MSVGIHVCVGACVRACVRVRVCVCVAYLALQVRHLLGVECVVGLREQGEQVHTHLLLALLLVLDLGPQRGHRRSNPMLNYVPE